MVYRYFLKIEYNGTLFHGFQKQKNTSQTVQEFIESAFSALTKEVNGVVCAGRTDAGVHARGQVIHTDLEKEWDPLKLMGGLNYYLKGAGVAVIDVSRSSLHARFDALERHYEYRILNRLAPSPLLQDRAWHIPFSLNIECMQEGCAKLIGHHNFNAFRSSDCQAHNPIRTLKTACINLCENDNSAISINFSALAFLHNQVRIMVGTLIEIGKGKRSVYTIEEAFSSGKRKDTGITAPPYGLYLTKVVYPADKQM